MSYYIYINLLQLALIKLNDPNMGQLAYFLGEIAMQIKSLYDLNGISKINHQNNVLLCIYCLLSESFNSNVSQQFFDYIITFENSQH